jgi:rSAM/selenodomain-associated transferase 1
MVFCKAPVAGQVKTRLAHSLAGDAERNAQLVARLHAQLAWHCLAAMTKRTLAKVELWCAPTVDHPFFLRCERELGVTLMKQEAGGLGERMARAFDHALSQSRYAVVVGTDCPVLDCNYIDVAFTCLQAEKGTVIGPAEDGGYVLLGLSRQQPALFKGIPWGEADVLEMTLARVKGRLATLPVLWDVDRAADLRRLVTQVPGLRLDQDLLDQMACSSTATPQ